MQQKVIAFNKEQKVRQLPDIQAGDVVRVHRKIKEGEKERVQVFEGIVIAIKGNQSSSPMITVRKVSQGIGVELVLPIFSATVDKIELVKRAKVRRSKLYFLRGLTAKKSRMKYRDLSGYMANEKKVEAKAEVAEVVEETKAEETEVKE